MTSKLNMSKALTIKKVIIIFSSLSISLILFFILITILIVNKPTIIDGVKASIDNITGNQIIYIKAKDGFSPKVNIVNSGRPSILKIDTNNTVDCSSTILIPKLGVNKILPASGQTDINVPQMALGDTIDGTCSGGIYSFKIIAQ